MTKKFLEAIKGAKRTPDRGAFIRLFDAEHSQQVLVNVQHVTSIEPLLSDTAPDTRSLIHLTSGCDEHELFVRESLDEIVTLAQSKG